MQTKKFSQELHDQFDSIAREKAKQLFKRYRMTLEDNPDKYGIDLIAYKDGELYGYVEVEVREAWTGEHFKYDTLNIPYRKRKLFLNPQRNCLVAFNSDCTYAFIVDEMTILFSDVQEVKNKHLPEGEMFFKVPVSELKKVKV